MKKDKAAFNKYKKDHNRCEICNSDYCVWTHHIITVGGKCGPDEEWNFIALCFNCHRKAHDGFYNNGVYITAKQFMISSLLRFKEKYAKAIRSLRGENYEI